MSNNGVVAEKRKASEQSYLKSIGTYVSGFSSYIPSGLKKQLSSTQTHEERDKVIWVGFDNYERDGKSRQCLLLSFVNGFQIWDIEEQPELIISELVSKREGAIKSFKFLQTPPSGAEKGRLTDKHPLVALASAEDSAKFPKTAVKLYSLREQEYINTMRFRAEVYSILCSKRMLVVALHDHIYGFDIVNMNKIFSRPYHPQDPQLLPQMRAYGRSSPSSRAKPPACSSLIALGPRWLAYPAKKVQSAKGDEPTSNTMDQLVEAAKYLSDIGYKTVSSYFSPDSQPAAPSSPALSPEDIANFGNVAVHDVCTGKTVAHFRAHKEPLSYLAFDPSGTLLVTAGAGGYEFNIFQIRPSPGPLHENVLHIYTLVRGRTSASITDITFSNDSRWMAVSTSHGTTHVYAINPEGGPVNIHTHIPSEPIASYEAPFIFNHPQEPKHVVLSVIDRIKQSYFVATEDTPKNQQPMTVASISSSPSQMKILVATHAGIVTQYNLRPHGPPPGSGDIDPKTLQLTVEPTFYWDVCRRSSWPQLLTRIKASKKNEPVDTHKAKDKSQKEPSWLSNVEICTHTPHFRPLWAGPQFTFKTYRKPAHGSLALFDQLAEPIKVETKIEAKYKAGTSSSSSAESSAWGGAELEEGIPSGSFGKELKDHINKAISTPMRFAEKRTDSVLVDSLVGDYKNGISGRVASSPPSSSSSSSSMAAVDNKKQEANRPHDNPPAIRMETNQQNLYSYDDDDY